MVNYPPKIQYATPNCETHEIIYESDQDPRSNQGGSSFIQKCRKVIYLLFSIFKFCITKIGNLITLIDRSPICRMITFVLTTLGILLASGLLLFFSCFDKYSLRNRQRISSQKNK